MAENMDVAVSNDGSPTNDIQTRPMRVKVLYSFDKDNKDKCLARFPNIMQIPTVTIEENSHVGVIELGHCLQAIVSASPELVSGLSEGDFTIYAYDYSEYDTPLVGQGMLSAALVAASLATNAEKPMITGRVCQNIPALFSNGVKETLEVKLRLVPIPRRTQSDGVKGVDGGRGISPATSAGFDPNAWNASLQHNRPQQLMHDHFDTSVASATRDKDLTFMDEMLGLNPVNSVCGNRQQSVGSAGMAETPTDPALEFNPAFSHSAPGSRAGSPMTGSESSIHNGHLRHQSLSASTSNLADQSRPGSHASMRSESQNQSHPSTQPRQERGGQSQTEIYYNDDGQPRKRAKVVQTDWRGRQSFGAKSSDLRVTAATAHSVEMHRPVPRRPGVSSSDLEPPPRVPTPVPQRHLMPFPNRQTASSQPRSLLRQASTATMNSDFMSDVDQYSDAIMSSPEAGSPNHSIAADGTPQDIPSSPPVFAGINAPEPSSPGLPSLPLQRVADSGYMSEPMFKSGQIVDDFDDDENRTPDAQDLEVAAQYNARSRQCSSFIKREGDDAGTQLPCSTEIPQSEMNVELEVPGDMTQLPHKMLLNLPPERYRERSQGPKQPKVHTPKIAVRSEAVAGPPANEDQEQSRCGSLALPRVHTTTSGQNETQRESSRPAPKRRSTKRPRAEIEWSEAGSPAPSDTEGRPRGTRRSGSGAQRRVIIQQRLEESLAKGNMPTYCNHCGAIETPTWRKLYVKHVNGKPSPLDEVEGEGETIGVEPLEWNPETSEVTRFVIRKSMKKTRDSTPGKGFEDTTLCNPCGLWFNKFRSMRPPEKWHRKTTSRRSKKQKDDCPDSMMTDAMEPRSEAFFTDNPGQNESAEAQDPPEESMTGNLDEGQIRQSPVRRPRANSMQPPSRRRSAGGGMNVSQLDVALTRAIQSSPVRYHGSQESPIEIPDITPKPTRRLLFPSPRRAGEVKSLDDKRSLNGTSPPRKNEDGKFSLPEKSSIAGHHEEVNVFEAFTFGKENVTPGAGFDDGLAHLFEGSPTTVFKTPRMTPSKIPDLTPRSQPRLNDLLKTPTPPSRKRAPLASNQNAANSSTTLGQPLHDFMTSPTSSRYFLRSTPSRQGRSPSARGSQHNGLHSNDMTPFSRHLAQMLSDANESASAATFTSPSRGSGLDFTGLADMAAFITPGRDGGIDWCQVGDILSSDFGAFEEDGKANDGRPQAEVESGESI
ncbi:MAG: hypothetical protein FE78DRAFT_93074 [Acidomyces sp. 'richmondensis']|nr:MAG: hypothetical protein FE78DRAFT_93074 [Acidomyces sp. 'richmondensis']